MNCLLYTCLGQSFGVSISVCNVVWYIHYFPSNRQYIYVSTKDHLKLGYSQVCTHSGSLSYPFCLTFWVFAPFSMSTNCILVTLSLMPIVADTIFLANSLIFSLMIEQPFSNCFIQFPHLPLHSFSGLKSCSYQFNFFDTYSLIMSTVFGNSEYPYYAPGTDLWKVC